MASAIKPAVRRPLVLSRWEARPTGAYWRTAADIRCSTRRSRTECGRTCSRSRDAVRSRGRRFETTRSTSVSETEKLSFSAYSPCRDQQRLFQSMGQRIVCALRLEIAGCRTVFAAEQRKKARHGFSRGFPLEIGQLSDLRRGGGVVCQAVPDSRHERG